MGAAGNRRGDLAWAAVWLALLPSGVLAQGPGPVEQLRAVLRGSAEPEWRDRATRECLAGLRTLADLERAASLTEWRDQDPDRAVAAVDQANRGLVADRFTNWVRAVLNGGDAAAQTATAELLAEMAATARARGEGPGLAGRFVSELTGLAAGGPAAVRSAAARALGQAGADPGVAVPVLAALLKAPEPLLRRAAAGALEDLLRAAATSKPGVPSPPRAAAVAAAVRVLPAVGPGLGDWHLDVRRRCLGAVAEAAALLGRLGSEGPAPERGARPDPALAAQATAERAELRPLALALSGQAGVLARAVRDADPEARVLAQKALEEMARARWRWLRQAADDGDDPLGDGLRTAVPALADAVADPEVRVRRAALDVLELLGPLAEPAIPALAGALTDRDRFVRWTAIRTLGRLGAPAARAAGPGLVRLLEDPDVDLRLAAAQALGRVDPAARAAAGEVVQASTLPPASSGTRTALPALVRSLRAGDAELRVAALHTLRGMDGDAQPALPALREALADTDAPVRQAAAEAIGALGAGARDAVDDLRRALHDPSEEVRRAAGNALLNVVGTPR